MRSGTHRRPAPAVDEAIRSRKRFARRQWARRWLAWRRVVALLLVVALLVGGGLARSTSPTCWR